MLAAISTTTLSRRSCALTGSAITSRSRRNSTRGPPSAPRIIQVLIQPGICPRLRLQPDHVRIATATAHARGKPNGLFAGAEWRPGLSLIQPVQRVQRAHGEVALGGLDQHGEFDLGGGDGE